MLQICSTISDLQQKLCDLCDRCAGPSSVLWYCSSCLQPVQPHSIATAGNKHQASGQTSTGAVFNCHVVGVLVHRHVHHYCIVAVLVDQKARDRVINGLAQVDPHTCSLLLIHTHAYPGVQHRKGYFDKLQGSGINVEVSLNLVRDSLKTTIKPSFWGCLDYFLPWKISMVVLTVMFSCLCFLLISWTRR